MSDNARMTTEHMSESFIENIETTFENWKPKTSIRPTTNYPQIIKIHQTFYY